MHPFLIYFTSSSAPGRQTSENVHSDEKRFLLFAEETEGEARGPGISRGFLLSYPNPSNDVDDDN